MNDQLKYRIFNTTDCLTEQAMYDYIDNKLATKEQHLVEKHLLACQLFTDAMEGLQILKNRNRIAEINQLINEKVATSTKKETKIILLNYKVITGIAAGLLLLIGSVFFFNQFTKKETLVDNLATEKSIELTPPAPQNSIVPNPEETKEVPAKDQTIKFETEITDQQNKQAFAQESKSKNNITTTGSTTEPVTTTLATTISSYDTENDADKKAEQTITLNQTDNSKMALEEVVVTNATTEKPPAAAADGNGYDVDERATTSKINKNIDDVGGLKKSDYKKESANNRYRAEEKKDKAGAEKPGIAMDSSFASVDVMPQFIGGPDSLGYFIKTNFHYNPSYYSWDNSLGTKIIVAFTVDTEGNCLNPQIIKGINTQLNNEALRLVNSMPKWKPAMNKGKAVNSIYNLPIQLEIH